MRPLALAILIALAAAVPAQALTVTARVSGGNIAVHEGPGFRYAIIGRLADGMEIPIDACTQNDSDPAGAVGSAMPATACAATAPRNGAASRARAGSIAATLSAAAWSMSPRPISTVRAGNPGCVEIHVRASRK
ncbi:hypothetical protein [Devosia ginsengisoli]|uniref:hypothetical protein n=1 Tax=Devosia ginsengisoli TaxID=400770 RepID=UPI0026F1875C|nr:hypothetical protein [Devosia ginsengisoli]MCR6673944.1 hypothetical protein [Devosia ginsengisoli]